VAAALRRLSRAMLEFETFVYLDVQKTGSTFVTRLLKQFCSEPEVLQHKHANVGDRYNPDKFHFITVRDPFDQYISLYSHGCGGKGGMVRRMRNQGKDHLYDSTWRGFRRWLQFVLDPGSASVLNADYCSERAGDISKLIGFQTYRYLELASVDAIEAFGSCKTRDDVREAYRTKNIVGFTVHHESFVEDLEELLTTKLRHVIKDLDGALRHVRETRKINASERIDTFELDPSISRKTEALFDEREWLLKELFGY
jgi:hypothetical protein